jgi:hypothetical protein
MPILVRSDDRNNHFGYSVYPQKDLPPEYVPWATLAGTTVVFAPGGSPPPRLGSLTPYTAADNKLRRGLCEEGLASLILQRRDFVETALTKVNDAILAYMKDRMRVNKDAASYMAQSFQQALFTDAYWDGRLGPAAAAPKSPDALLAQTESAMRTANVAIVLNIHATVVFSKFFDKLGTASAGQAKLLERWWPKLGPDQPLFKQRGRRFVVVSGPPTREGVKPGHHVSTRGGFLPESEPKGAWDVPARVRGVDEWDEDTANPTPFTKEMHDRNFTYVAGASGTTGGLLLGALVLANLVTEEDIKQYVLACVGFLIGGGHHNYHEIMVIAAQAGCPYVTGEFLPSLPRTFLCSPEFEIWKQQYYDIVTNRAL